MNPDIKALLKPELLNTLNGLELIARIIVEGFMSGSNKSQSVGVGQEFSQYRGYEPGDDLRQLDWKMYARSERYFIKQADIETNITVKFMLDASHSMAYTENGMSKLQYAKIMIAALAYLARKQSDTIGLYAVNERLVQTVQPRVEQQQFMRFLNTLINIKSEGTWKKEGSLEFLFDHHGKEMIIFITDLYDDNNDLAHFITRLKTPRNEVMVFQILGQNERDLSYGGSFTFEDLENGTRLKADTHKQQPVYQERLHEWLQHWRGSMLEKNIHYQLVMLNESVDKTLRDFLRIRKISNR